MSKISAKQYATALLDVLETGVAEKKAVTGLLNSMISRGDIGKRSEVLAAIEQEVVKRNGGRLVRAEFAHALGINDRKDFLSSWSERDRVTTAVNPDLVAGVRILVNGESELDLGLRARLDRVIPF